MIPRFVVYLRALTLTCALWACLPHDYAAREAGTEVVGPASDSTNQVTALQLHKRSRELTAKGGYAQAIQYDERALELARKEYGPRHAYVAFILDALAGLNERQQHFDVALMQSREAADIVADARGRDSIDYASMLRRTASIYASSGDYRQAAPVFQNAYDIVVARNGRDSGLSAQLARDVGASLLELNQYDAATEWLIKALNANRATHGESSVETALAYLDLAEAHIGAESIARATNEALNGQRILQNEPSAGNEDLARADMLLAQIDISDSELDSAKERLDTALRLVGESEKPDPAIRAMILYYLGWINLLRRQSVEAELIYTQTLEIYRSTVGESNPMVGRVAHCLAIVYKDLGQFELSEQYYMRAIEIFTKVSGSNDASVAATRLEYSLLLSEAGRLDESIRQAQMALAIYTSLPGQWDLKRGYALADLALAEHRADNLDDAAKKYEQALVLMRRARGNESSDLPPGLTDLASIYRQQRRFNKAQGLLDQAIAIRRKDQASTPAGLSESLSELASLRLAQGRVQEALAASREATDIARRRLDVEQSTLSESAIGEERRGRGIFERFLDAGVANRPLANDALLREMFEVAQLPHLSGTAGAVGQMAVRAGASDSSLRELVRKREDAAEQWRALNRSVVDSLTQVRVVDSGTAKDTQDRAALAQLNTTIAQMDETLRKQFPSYAELTNPGTVSVDKVQSLLKSDEALFLQVTSTTATYVFLVTRDGLDFARTDMNAHQLHEAVESIRNGLDWSKKQNEAASSRFDVANAYFLYENLLQPFENRLRNVRHIVAVVDRWMQSLPLSLLLTERASHIPAANADYRDLAFFVRRFSFTIEPSVSAFVSLRAVAKRSLARLPFIGFGDPVLAGTGNAARGVLNDALVTRIDPAILRTELMPLPDTRIELTEIALTLHADRRDLYFGPRATKPVVMQIDLTQFRIISFATHALVAGDFEGQLEPALVLTPPVVATPDDNGLLGASDVATLKLDADWVLLSACNTASSEGRVGAEGLSGLAKAFFYAGTRALLVSHWTVDSAATVELMTRTMQALVSTPEIGRAEALRRAMLSMLDDPTNTRYGHPVFWAPFFNVGEGGRIR